MGLFSNKKRNGIKDKLTLIENITEVEKEVTDAKLFVISKRLYKIIDLLDNPEIMLDDVQIARINIELETIKKYPLKGYEELLKNKCDLITSIIKKEINCLDGNNDLKDNEERIYRLLGEQNELIAQISALTIKMDNVMGKDKGMWQLLNMQRNNLYTKLALISKNYSTILIVQSNLLLSNDLRKAKDETEAILSQANLIDKHEFEGNESFVTKTNDEVFDESNKLCDSFVTNLNINNDEYFSLNNDEYSYEKALELKALSGDTPMRNCNDEK